MGEQRRCRVTGPLEKFASGFAAELVKLGYLPRVVGARVRLMADLSGWMEGEGLDASGLTTSAAERFLAGRLEAGRARYVAGTALVPLLDHLRGLGVAPLPDALVVGPVEAMLESYRRYLTVERGLTAGTARGYLDAVRPFVAGRCRGEQLDVAGLATADVTRFVVAACSPGASRRAKTLPTALRSLLGFWHVEGLLPVPLAASVPSVASWRMAGLPRPLEPEQLRRLLGSCDRTTVAGRRDFAMLVLLARLGLRSGEVARLGLDDIDWRAGEIVVRGKGPRLERLPLPDDVGEAIANYLRHGRPATAQDRTAFMRVVAPHRALTSGGVTQAVFAAGRRARLGSLYAHRLRHSAATDMLRAGASLPDIGQVLRHRRALTTAIYAKVDHHALRSIARAWPGSAR